jgi:hypothetical protein
MKPGVPHISLVFREMWDATNLGLRLSNVKEFQSSAVVSHISRKTSEMWGTRHLLIGTQNATEIVS